MDSGIHSIVKQCTKFTYDAYAQLLNHLKEKFVFKTFSEFQTQKNEKNDAILFLRHDIDGHTDPALRMAEIENKNGIKSTFFVLFSAKYYNVLDASCLETLLKISELGHEIGLHYDIVTYEKYQIPFQDILSFELKLLEKIVKKPINVIARHNVSTTGLDPFKGWTNPLNVYNDFFFKNANYVSDSCRAWYFDDLTTMMTGSQDVVQLLIHPMLWSGRECTRTELLERFFSKKETLNKEFKEQWISLWENTIHVQKYEKELKIF